MADYNFYFRRTSGTLKYFKWTISVEKLNNKYRWTLVDDFSKGWSKQSGNAVSASAGALWDTNSSNYISLKAGTSTATATEVYRRVTGSTTKITETGQTATAPVFIITVNNGTGNDYMMKSVSTSLTGSYSSTITQSNTSGTNAETGTKGTAYVYWVSVS